MNAENLVCRDCGKKMPLGRHYLCPGCSGLLEVAYNYKSIPADQIHRSFCKGAGENIWQYGALLPVANPEDAVTLGEGGTPLLKARHAAEDLGLERLYFKLESNNPTGSFKDRPYAVGVSRAVELGSTALITASAGNAGIAMAAYGARAGLQCIVCVPENTPSLAIAQIKSHGAVVLLVEGTVSRSINLVKEASKQYGLFNVTSNFINPYTVEGNKTVAYEIWRQLKGEVPDWVVIPIGAGPLLVGCFKGFQELIELGLAKKLPAMVGVQAQTCAPIAEAFKKGQKNVSEWHEPINSFALGITDPLIDYPQDGTLTLRTIIASRGASLAVTDEEIKDSICRLAKEGVFSEPAGAASLAVLEKMVASGAARKEDVIVSVITGHGLKAPYTLIEPGHRPHVIRCGKELGRFIH